MDRLEVSDEHWNGSSHSCPRGTAASAGPGRLPLDDRACLNGIRFVLVTGIGWDRLPRQLGDGSGVSCWRRLRDWTAAGVWNQLHQLRLAEFHAAEQLDWSRAVADASHVRAPRGPTRSDQARSTGPGPAASTMW